MPEVLSSNLEPNNDGKPNHGETPTNAATPEALRWSVRLGDEFPQKRWIVVFVAIAAGVAGQLLFHHPLFAIIGFLAILLSGAEVIFPVHCTIDGEGASSRCGISTSSIEWSNVRRTIELQDGVRLSPVAAGSALEPFRGVFLRFAGNRDAVLAKIRAFTGENEQTLG